MSAIARYFKFRGYEVSGYDRTPSELTAELEKEGIAIHYEDNPEYVPKNAEETLVVYTPAIPHDMGELVYVLKHGYKVVKRSRILGEITQGQRCLAVAGTHGKTTTSTLLAHIFESSGEGCSAFLGGISKNYGSNLLTAPNDVVVAEADEFDRSFLQLHPEIAVITAMDADHLDIYSDLEHVKEAFKAFASQVTGTVIRKYGLDITSDDTRAKIRTYSYDDARADFHAENIRKDECGGITFDLVYPEGRINDCRTGVPGWVNTENGIAAAAIALAYGLEPEKIREALGTFAGVKRRFDVHYNRPGHAYVDDYAHHPAEIRASIESVRKLYPNRKLTGVFQPHLYSRTRDFAEGFAESLSLLDELIMLPIYPARELPIEGVSSALIYEKVVCPVKQLVSKDQLLQVLSHREGEVILTLGAGDIDALVPKVAEMLKNEYLSIKKAQ